MLRNALKTIFIVAIWLLVPINPSAADGAPNDDNNIDQAQTAPLIWETDFGNELSQLTGTDDQIQHVDLDFDFPFRGASYGGVFVSSNGIITLGTPPATPYPPPNSPEQFSQIPMIAPFYSDMSLRQHGTVFLNTLGGRAVITWLEIGFFKKPLSTVTFQVQLMEDGRIVFGYNGIAAELDEILIVGLSPGHGLDGIKRTDFSSGALFRPSLSNTAYGFSAEPPRYEVFDGERKGFDLDGGNLVFTPFLGEFSLIPTDLTRDAIWIGGTVGNWDDRDNWNSNTVPNNGNPTPETTYHVKINEKNSLDATVKLNIDVTLDNLTIGEYDQLVVLDETTLGISARHVGSGVIRNQGFILLESIGTRTTLQLSGGGETLLTGGGVVTLSDNTSNYIVGTTGSEHLINEDNIIQGAGIIGDNNLTLTNRGLVDANAGNPLTIALSQPGINDGVFRASSGGTLIVESAISGIGDWVALGGTIQINSGADITTTGVIDITNNGTLQFPDADLSGSDLTVDNTGTLDINGTITLFGNFSFRLTDAGRWNWTDIAKLKMSGGQGATIADFSNWSHLEIGGADIGQNGFTTNNFYLPELIIGADAHVILVDRIDNGNRQTGISEALYVNTLVFDDESVTLSLNGLRLYYNTLNGDSSQLIDLAEDGSTPTETGTNVQIQPVDTGTGASPVNVSFPQVTQAGTTSLDISEVGPTVPVPQGFAFPDIPVYFDITTTATFFGTVTVCFDYSGLGVSNELSLRLLHFDGTEWEDITTNVNTEDKEICGEVASLSPFVIVEALLTITDITITDPPEPIPVETEVTVIGSFTGEASTTYTAIFDWGYGPDGTVIETDGSGSVTATHTYITHGIFDVTLTVTDNTTGFSQSGSVPVTIFSPPSVIFPFPWVNEGGTFSGDEGTYLELKATAGSPHQNDATLTYEWDIDYDGETFNGGPTTNPSGVFLQDGPSTSKVAVQVTDDQGLSTIATTFLQAINVPPVISLVGDDTITEGSDYTLTLGEVTDPGDDTVTEYIVDWGDGAQEETFTAQEIFTANGEVTHIYTDGDNTLVISVDLVDEDGTHAAAGEKSITVTNVPPVVEAGLGATVNEGDTFTGSGSFTDPSPDDSWTATVDYGDETGSQPLTLNADKTFSLIHLYADDGSYTVTVTVTDDDNDSGSDPLTVTVNNVPPMASAINDGPKVEEATVTVTASQTDPGTSDTFTYSFDWNNDGTYEIVDQVSPSASNTWDDDGTYIVGVMVEDDDGGVGTATTDVTVTDLAPTAEFTWTPEPQDEGSAVAFTDLSASSPDAIVAWSWDFAGLDTSSEQNPLPFTLMDHGFHEVRLTVTDDDGSTATISHIVTVVDLGPTAEFTWTSEPKDGGSAVDFTDASTSSPDTITSWSWDFDDLGSSADQNPSFTFIDSGNYTIALTVTDDDGTENAITHTVAVNNVAPEITSIVAPMDPVEVGTAIIVDAIFTDLGDADNHTATWDWGDDSTSDGPVGTVTGTHTYIVAGVYRITLTVTNGDGDSGESIFEFIVIYNPDGGFVTGGGWINSPEGAYPADPLSTGKLNFGFNAKHKGNEEMPTGQTEFNFKKADLNLHSETYDWLVVANHKAQCKGIATINHEGNYGFMLIVIDESLSPDTDVGLFRMKIWDIDNNDAIVYDSQMGAPDDADPTTPIGGGNVKIHQSAAAPARTSALAELMMRRIPAKTELLNNYPNPFNPDTWIPGYRTNCQKRRT